LKILFWLIAPLLHHQSQQHWADSSQIRFFHCPSPTSEEGRLCNCRKITQERDDRPQPTPSTPSPDHITGSTLRNPIIFCEEPNFYCNVFLGLKAFICDM
jgi:hypothetical protein